MKNSNANSVKSVEAQKVYESVSKTEIGKKNVNSSKNKVIRYDAPVEKITRTILSPTLNLIKTEFFERKTNKYIGHEELYEIFIQDESFEEITISYDENQKVIDRIFNLFDSEGNHVVEAFINPDGTFNNAYSAFYIYDEFGTCIGNGSYKKDGSPDNVCFSGYERAKALGISHEYHFKDDSTIDYFCLSDAGQKLRIIGFDAGGSVFDDWINAKLPDYMKISFDEIYRVCQNIPDLKSFVGRLWRTESRKK